MPDSEELGPGGPRTASPVSVLWGWRHSDHGVPWGCWGMWGDTVQPEEPGSYELEGQTSESACCVCAV